MDKTFLTKEHNTASGRKIYIFDDVFDYSARVFMYNFTQGSVFTIQGYDSKLLEYKEHLSLVSVYTPHDVERLRLFELLPQEIKDKFQFNFDNLKHTLINLCTPSDRFHTHVDTFNEEGWTVLYYLNTEWDPEWGGDTVFFDESGKEFELVSQFKPGRFVVFDSQIPHLIRTSTVLAPHFRLTFAAKFLL